MLLFGHRGAAGEAPENTVAGFLYARSCGVQAFEFDVHLTADDALAVIHDNQLDRTTNATGAVASFTATQLAKLDARYKFPAWPTRFGVPTLEDVLQVVPGCQLQIEIKSDTADHLNRVCQLLAMIVSEKDLVERTIITSFDETALARMQQLSPSIPRSLIGGFTSLAMLNSATALACSWICPHLPSTTEALIHAAKSRGIKISAWMGNTLEELATLVTWNVDAIISDYPGTALVYLRERGVLNEA